MCLPGLRRQAAWQFKPKSTPMPACRAPLVAAFLQIAALLDSEYTPEEAAAIGLTPAAELAALLDSLS